MSGNDSDLLHFPIMGKGENVHELEDYIAHMRAAGAPETTIRTRRVQIRRCLAAIGKPAADIGLEDLIGYLAAQAWKPETRKAARSALRGFFTWAEDTGRIAANPSTKLPGIHIPQGQPRPTPTDIFTRALAGASDRDRLMLMLAAYAGLRRSEISRVHADDLIGDELRIIGKGGKVRTLPMQVDLLEALGGRRGYIFPGRDDGHLSPDAVGRRLKQLLGPGWSGHTLRHRFATRAYAAGADFLAVRDLLGHTSVATTQRYTATPDNAMRRAIEGVA